MSKHGLFVMAMMAALGACGSSSSSNSVDPALDLATLTAGEVTQECRFIVRSFPEVSATCSDGSVAHVNGDTQTQCEDRLDAVKDGCTLTVGDFEDCLDELDKDPCTGDASAACDHVFDGTCFPQ